MLQQLALLLTHSHRRFIPLPEGSRKYSCAHGMCGSTSSQAIIGDSFSGSLSFLRREQSARCFAREGPSEIEPLGHLTPHLLHAGGLLGRLHALDNRRQSQRVRHVEHSRNYLGTFFRVFSFPVYEQAVYLQHVQQGMLEVDKRAIACTEVIERELHAQLF